ncbi:MAG: hypothetical protein J0I20_10120 [Chloroflexi bacterium]|nr:hypothetical protein [Chloroflexota bacterium]OJV94547.1 MAG: hypothetical protein BGO39_22690 [Chloroflexi bacterium 54-19]
MSEEEHIPEGNDTYDLMLRLEQLESLREDMEETGFDSLAQVESALALTVPGTDAATDEKRTLLVSIRDDLLELGLVGLDEVETEIEELNSQLDETDDDF